MNLRNSLLLLFCSLSIFLYSQTPTWYSSYTTLVFPTSANMGTLYELDNSLIGIKGRNLGSFTHFGESLSERFLPAAIRGNYSLQDRFLDMDLVIGRRGADDLEGVVLTLSDGFSSPVEFEISDNLGPRAEKGPAAVKVSNGNYLIFGNQFFQKVQLNADTVLTTEWTTDNSFGLIAAADQDGDQFILCNEQGDLILVDGEGNPVWNKEYNAKLFSVKSLNGDGYVACGEKDGKAYILKTDTMGELVWEKSYDSSIDFSEIIVDSNGDYVAVGTSNSDEVELAKHSSDGILLWSKPLPEGELGTTLIESRYGGYWVLGYDAPRGFIYRVDSEGEAGPFIEPMVNKSLAINGVSSIAPNPAFSLIEDYRFPADSATTTIYTSGLWISSMNDNTLHLSAQTYSSSADFQPGFIGSDNETMNKVWSVKREGLDFFKEDIQDGTKDQPWPLDIITWPAKGNPNVIINNQLVDIPIEMAPFVDVNNDQIYNAYDGDYPLMKGDEMLWWVINDEVDHANSGGTPLGVDVKCSFYAWACDAANLSYNSSFLQLEVINRSENDYTDVRLGIFSDFDLGCSEDDYLGSVPDANACYVYNATEIDASGGNCNTTPFGSDEIPVQSVTFLNQDMSSLMYFNNGGVGFPNPVTTDPTSDLEFNHYLNHRWRDGTPLTHGGTGFNPLSTDETDFAFPGNPSQVNEWSECESGNSTFRDRRAIAATSFSSLPAGESLSLDVAYVTHTDVPLPCPDNSTLISDLAAVQSSYDSGWVNYILDLGPDRIIEQGQTIELILPEGAVAYNWSNGSMSNSISIESPGEYSVTVTTPLGCDLTDEISVSGSVGVREFRGEGINVFPNPASGFLTIELQKTGTLDEIQVINMVGKVCGRCILTPNTISLNMDINDLPEGIYFLNLFSKGKIIDSKKVVTIK